MEVAGRRTASRNQRNGAARAAVPAGLREGAPGRAAKSRAAARPASHVQDGNASGSVAQCPSRVLTPRHPRSLGPGGEGVERSEVIATTSNGRENAERGSRYLRGTDSHSGSKLLLLPLSVRGASGGALPRGGRESRHGADGSPLAAGQPRPGTRQRARGSCAAAARPEPGGGAQRASIPRTSLPPIESSLRAAVRDNPARCGAETGSAPSP